ncbi:MAG TPA: hypothetical protein DIC52_11350 [Candidatus Latescibacteria bacterium]|nr:hypothetical protein [Candidatus Latescibacterota bacterium]
MSETRLLALLPFAACLLLAQGVMAGPNPDYVVSVDGPVRIDNPAVGQSISLAVRASGTTEVKGVVVRVLFDPAVVEFLSYTLGDITPGALALPKAPDVREDGLAEVDGGSTILGKGLTTVTTGGLLSTFHFEVIGELTEGGSGIWVTSVELNTSADPDDEDVFTYDDGELGIRLVRRFSNRIFNAEVTRRFNGATIAWESRLVGLTDTLRIRPSGDSDWRIVTSQSVDRFDTNVVTAARVLFAAGIAINDSNTTIIDSSLTDVGLGPPYADDFFPSLLELRRLLLLRRHLVAIDSLTADTQYEYAARSTELAGSASNQLTGRFRTRLAPDLRPAAASDLDVQATRRSASASWFTNRPADTQLLINDTDGNQVGLVLLDPEGTFVHAATVGLLLPDTEYSFVVTSRLVGADNLIADGLLTEEDVTVVKMGTFRTRAERQAVRLLAPPTRVVSPETAVINFQLNQIALATIDYAETTFGDPDSAGTELYEFSTSSGDILNGHSVTLSDLSPSTAYRFRISVVTPDGDSLSTDPRGNQQWSRDLRFRTSAAGDTLPPVIVEGPFVIVRDVLGVVTFVTDVDTRASVFFGTKNGTYGTADEFEIADQTASGSLRLSQEHAITISGLDPASAYDYGIIVEATNGQTASFEPNLPASKSARAGKRLKILQPPGGAGSFTTNIDPDTQYPVILSGPTISSKTHDTAIVEWLTDEPANSDVQFGAESVSEGRTNSGVSQTSHKMVLSNLEPGSPYLFQVGSTDAAGNGATTSAEGVFSTNPEVDLTAPEITEEPAVIYQNDEVATIQWTTDEDATAQIDFGTAADSLLFIRTSSSTGDDHEITLTNLTPATEYFYQVTSSDLSNNGPTVTDVLSFTTDPEPDATPPVLSDVVVTAADFSAIVTWLTDELADSFVDLGTVSGLLDVTVGDASDVLEHDVALTNLQPDTEYFLTVGSGDRAGNGPTESVEVSFTTLAAPDTSAPGAPTGLTGTAGNESVALSWETNSEADLGGYNLYRRLTGDGSFVAIATLLPTPGYTDLGLDNGSSYEYQITAIDRASPGNESDPGLDLSLSPTLSAAPTAPSDLSVDGEALRPTFSFTNAEPFSSGATLTYTIQVSTQSDFSDVTASESGITSGSAATSWTITRSLDDGATYYWRARAVEGDLMGPFTVTEEFTASTGPLLLGDFNDSGAVDFDDFFAFVDAFGGSADDFPDFDLNDSGAGTFIDFDDFFRFVDAFGTTASKTAQTVASTHPVDESAQIRLIADAGLDGTSSLPRDVVQLLVQADALNDVDAYGLTLTWDPAALSFTDAQAGPTAPDNNWFRILEQRPGRILLGNARSDGGLMETGVLAQLTFRLRDRQLANGTRIELEQLLLASTSGVRLAPPIPSASLRPSGFALGQAYPNPFNPSTQIDFALAAETSARLVIYDVLGRVVRTLVPGQSMPAGFYSVSWDGRDTAGRAVGNGLYFYRLATPDFVGTGRMMMLK